MTDLTPSDLSHLSDKEFNALAPQGHHAPGPEPLSPAAQAVWTAYEKAGYDPYVTDPRRAELAAALRAAADQIDHDWPAFNCIDALYEIATELEDQ